MILNVLIKLLTISLAGAALVLYSEPERLKYARDHDRQHHHRE